MKRLAAFGSVASLILTVLSLSWGASNLNLSKSNINRLIYPVDIMTPAQAGAVLVELDKLGPADEAKVKQWLTAIFKKVGIPAERIKKIIVRPADRAHPQTTIVLLSNLADEPQALALLNEGAPMGRPSMPTR